MTISIGSNISALRVLRRFDDTSSLATQAFERLASGMRINRPADDAAGLALSDKLAADARITSRGRLNVNDGISALHIASSAIDSISSLLVRQAELAEQAGAAPIRQLDISADGSTIDFYHSNSLCLRRRKRISHRNLCRVNCWNNQS